MIDDRYSDRYIIDTPEHIEFGYDVAGVGSRFLAALVDTVLFTLIILFIMVMIERVLDADSMLGVIVIVGSSLLQCGYYIAFERFWNGQTPGKRVLGLRVVQDTGRPVSFAASIIRNLIRLVDFLPMFYGLAVIIMFVDKRARRLGDLAAGTLVVRDRQRITLDDLLVMTRSSRVASALAANSQTVLPNLGALRPEDIALTQDFLGRRASLPPDRRQRVAGQLAYALFQRLGYSVPGDAELFLQQVVDQYVSAAGQRLWQ